jgi:S1-C subfamily serine protease
MSRKLDVVFIALIIVALAAIGLLLSNLSKKASATALSLDTEIESAACEGSVRLMAELKDESGNRIPDALVSFHAGKNRLDSLYTDRNGRAWAEFPLNRSWCGRRIDFLASFDGGNGFGKSSDADPVAIRSPSNIVLDVPNESSEGEVFTVSARLSDALSGNPIPDKNLNIGQIYAKTDLNGTAAFNMSFSQAGSGEISAYFEGSEFFEPSESVKRRITVIPLMCEDGTEVGKCSGGLLCTGDRMLEADCEICGCIAGLLCADNECISEEQRVQRLIQKLQESNVKIQSDEGIGSGVIIGRNGSDLLILTNRHVVDADFTFRSNTHLQVLNYTNETANPVRIYIAPNQLDMAIVAVSKDIGPPAEIDYSLRPEVGAEVLAIGSPLGIPNSVTSGIVSNYVITNTTSGFDYEVMQTDAAVNPGNSGGGVHLSASGKLIGIISFKLVLRGNQLAEGLGFAIPVSLVEEYPLEEWKIIAPN